MQQHHAPHAFVLHYFIRFHSSCRSACSSKIHIRKLGLSSMDSRQRAHSDSDLRRPSVMLASTVVGSITALLATSGFLLRRRISRNWITQSSIRVPQFTKEQTIIITGRNTGLGFEAAKYLAHYIVLETSSLPVETVMRGNVLHQKFEKALEIRMRSP